MGGVIVLIKLKLLRCHPHVCAVGRYVDGHITHQFYAYGVAVVAKALPIGEKSVLQKLMIVNFVLIKRSISLSDQLSIGTILGCPEAQLLALVVPSYRHKQCVGLKPKGIFFYKVFIVTVWGKFGKGLAQKLIPCRAQGRIIDIAAFTCGKLDFIQQSILNKPLKVDIKLAACKGRQGLIGYLLNIFHNNQVIVKICSY